MTDQCAPVGNWTSNLLITSPTPNQLSYFVPYIVLIKWATSSIRVKSFLPFQEALFEQSVRQNVYEERQNQLRWQSKLGENQMHQKARLKALDQREDSWRAYKVLWILSYLGHQAPT